MKFLLLSLILLASKAVAAEPPKPTEAQIKNEQSAGGTEACLPLRTPGIAESASSYNDYVRRRCQTSAPPAEKDTGQ